MGWLVKVQQKVGEDKPAAARCPQKPHLQFVLRMPDGEEQNKSVGHPSTHITFYNHLIQPPLQTSRWLGTLCLLNTYSHQSDAKYPKKISGPYSEEQGFSPLTPK